MKLTQLLLKGKVWKRHRLPGGNIYTGKHRIVKPASPLDVDALERDLQIENKNMFYLRHSYLTEAESKLHGASREYHRNSIKQFYVEKAAIFSKPVRLSDTLAKLKRSESWE